MSASPRRSRAGRPSASSRRRASSSGGTCGTSTRQGKAIPPPEDDKPVYPASNTDMCEIALQRALREVGGEGAGAGRHLPGHLHAGRAELQPRRDGAAPPAGVPHGHVRAGDRRRLRRHPVHHRHGEQDDGGRALQDRGGGGLDADLAAAEPRGVHGRDHPRAGPQAAQRVPVRVRVRRRGGRGGAARRRRGGHGHPGDDVGQHARASWSSAAAAGR